MPKLDLQDSPQTNATAYPSPWREEMAGRLVRRLGPASGLSDFGVSHVSSSTSTAPPAASPARTAHLTESENRVRHICFTWNTK
jgi:uncharacterized cupin superfamily protein